MTTPASGSNVAKARSSTPICGHSARTSSGAIREIGMPSELSVAADRASKPSSRRANQSIPVSWKSRWPVSSPSRCQAVRASRAQPA